LAALAVVALHSGNRVDSVLPTGVSAVLSLGHAGVDLFFVISGFIMWSIGKSASYGPTEFLVRRSIRVAPPYWIATVAWLIFVIAAGYGWIVVNLDHLLWSMAFLPHFSPTFEGQIWPFLVPGWTLTYEMFFYLIFAAALMTTANSRLIVVTVVLTGLVALGVALVPVHAWAIVVTSPLLLEFLGGCLVAELWMRQPGGVIRNLMLVLGGFALLAAFGGAVEAEHLWSRTLGFGLPAVLIVLGAAGLGNHVPRLSMLERLGDASYSIYLFHILMVTLMSEAWQRLPGLHTPATAILFVLIALVLASGTGLLIFRLIELPLQKWLTRLCLVRARRPNVTSR
jgi:exopolysaccharide production protein ExoZ